LLGFRRTDLRHWVAHEAPEQDHSESNTKAKDPDTQEQPRQRGHTQRDHEQGEEFIVAREPLDNPNAEEVWMKVPPTPQSVDMRVNV